MILHNVQFNLGLSSFKTGINQFSDTMFEEFIGSNNLNDSMKKTADEKLKKIEFEPFEIYDKNFASNFTEIPLNFDWRNLKAVAKVENQIKCGSCYAMITIDSIESQLFIRTGNLTELSVQEIVDCAGDYAALGCAGGIPFKVYDYVKDKGSISSADDYPYKGIAGTCQEISNKIQVKLKGYGYVESENDELLMKALVQKGPIVVGIVINHDSFYRYSSGIYDERRFTDIIHHAMLLVGFGNENGVSFWILKNSWSETWGEKGFMRMARNEKRRNGVGEFSIYPILE